MYVYIYISWAIEKSGCLYDGLQIILLVGNDIHDKWICEKGSIWRIPLFQIHYYKHKNVIIYEKNSLFHVDSHGDKVGEERMDKLSAKPPFCPYFYYILCEG